MSEVHTQARTTPRTRAEIKASSAPLVELAERYNISRATVAKWKRRETPQDLSHRPHKLSTTLTPPQEAIAVELRRLILLPLDDLLVVVREFINPHVSRSGLDRCLRRHGVANLRELQAQVSAQTGQAQTTIKTFKDYEPGFLHMDIKYLPQMPDEADRRYLFFAIDRATRWVFVHIEAWLVPLRHCEWVVYAKRPFAGPQAVLAYLSRYTHRVAISNSRLLALDERGVTFRWKDYRVKEGAGGKTRHKAMTLTPEEFMRRFLLHVLPGGHSALACALRREGIEFVQEDNAFLRVADLARAQALADAFNPEQLHRRLSRYAHWLCPVADVFAQEEWHWSIRQAEYSTDLMFRSEQILVPLYDAISRQAVLAADAPRVAGFLGKKITPTLAQEIGSRLSTRIEGRCIKHYMGAAGVKVYDKFSRVLRVETTVNDVSFFKHHRKVEHKGAAATRELAPLKKSIYSLIDLREILLGCNQRYLAFLSSLDDPSAGERDLQRLSQPRVGADPSVKGLNFFNATDRELLCTLQHGEFNIHGWRRADLVARLGMTPSAMTRQLKRLRGLGLIKKVTHTYRYYLTRLGRAAIAAACSLTRFNIVPAMAAAH